MHRLLSELLPLGDAPVPLNQEESGQSMSDYLRGLGTQATLAGAALDLSECFHPRAT